ncbi:EamA-like transporter family protein [Anatilimnocola aggregata]|uniref:EamA-like transporter family protein n=1 Tax=Anatilimnocola aggregata TaxID=2528021 RepID=A0A517Y8P5_9BACT|nr:DMT family transporter [Anatilimnocola aggregata]QDU26512.1 EamA-like transporter family protein [Anatilimnocola aggregata]
MNSPPFLPYTWMLLSATAFSVMAICTRALAGQCNWQVIAIFRTGLAMLFAAMLAYRAGAKFAVFRPPTLWMRSLAGSVSLLCGFYAMTHGSVSEVIVMTNMYPLWVAVLSWPILGEMPSLEVWAAMLLSIAGVCLMHPPQELGGQLAYGAALLSAFTSGIALIGLHKLKDLDPRAIVTHFSGVALLLSLVACFVFPQTLPTKITPSIVLLLLGVGTSATVGQLLLTKAFTSANAARVSVVGLSQVAIVMLLEGLIWQRSFSVLTLFGMCLVVAPTAWMILRRAR